MMSGIIPRPFIDELLSRTDIVEWIDSYIPLKKVGNSHVACCPFHNEKSPSFNVIPKKQFYHCFGCGANGNAISFAMDYLHLSFPEAIEALAARAGLQVPREGNEQKTQPSKSLYQVLEAVSQVYQSELKKAPDAITYLKQRGIDGETAKRFQLGYAPAAWHHLETTFKTQKQELIDSGMLIKRDDGKIYDRYRQRITFPIHDKQGRIIGFGGRAIAPDQKPKYLNSPETAVFQKNRELYGLYQAVNAQKSIPYLIIVEGYLDVIALAQHGITNGVAALGTATSSFHIQLLNKYTKRIIFCFDGDSAGKQAAWRALESCLPFLNEGLDASFVFLPEQEDPDSLVRKEGQEAFLTRLEAATPLNTFLLNTLLQTIDISTFAGKSQLIKAFKPHLSKINQGPYQQLVLNELARLTHIDMDRLLKLIEEHQEPLQAVEQTIHRSPTRIAVAMLLQHPEVYFQIVPLLTDEIVGLQSPLIKTLIEFIGNNPQINTGALLEPFRDSQAFQALSQLATWDHKVPAEALPQELGDTIRFLAKQEKESTIQRLLNKARQKDLTDEDRLQLQKMLQLRHKPLDKEVPTD